MSAIFTHALRYEFLNRNSITLVRQSAERERLPDVLTAAEIGSLLSRRALIPPEKPRLSSG